MTSATPTTGTLRDGASSGRRWARGLVRRTATEVGSRGDKRLPRVRALLTRGLTVFVFHDITDAPSEYQLRAQNFTTIEAFRQQVLWIGDRFELIGPMELKQLGGTGGLPARAALVTFDDAWAGVFRAGIPLLSGLGVPALCFVNMATVQGAPDLGAVRRFEDLRPPPGGSRLRRALGAESARTILDEINHLYGSSPEFASFQGETATPDDLHAAADRGSVWLGSHFFHHWDSTLVAPDVLSRSLRQNAEALRPFTNVVPALATPYGHELTVPAQVTYELGIRVVFVATGNQNRDGDGWVLDRVSLEPEPSGPAEWWYSTHRRRLFGALAR